VVLRGDHLILSGDVEDVERAAPVALRLIELARIGYPFGVEEVRRAVAEVGLNGRKDVEVVTRHDDFRIVLSGACKVMPPKSEGQRAYMEAIAKNDIVISIGPAGTGKTYLGVAMAADALV